MPTIRQAGLCPLTAQESEVPKRTLHLHMVPGTGRAVTQSPQSWRQTLAAAAHQSHPGSLIKSHGPVTPVESPCHRRDHSVILNCGPDRPVSSIQSLLETQNITSVPESLKLCGRSPGCVFLPALPVSQMPTAAGEPRG